MSEFAAAGDGMGINVRADWGEAARSHTRWDIARFDEDAVSWASRRMGGDRTGAAGFIQPTVYGLRAFGVKPYGESVVIGNLVTNVGWGRIARLAIGTAVTAFTTATTRIGVGTGTAGASGNDTNLGGTGAAGALFKLITGAGTATDGTGTSGTGSATLAFVATFGTGDANFAWQEFGMDQGTADGTAVTAPLLNHKISSQGTKASGQTWTATVTFSFSSS